MCVMTHSSPQSPLDPSVYRFIVAIDIGSEQCSFCVFRPDKSLLVKATEMANASAGFAQLHERLSRLGGSPEQVLVGMEATSRYGEILFQQLTQIQSHLAQLDEELEKLRVRDPESQLLQAIPEFGPQTVAVLRAELGDVARFHRTDQAVAYAGLDIAIKESGKWQGQAKLSKRGSGLLRQMLYLAAVRSVRFEGSAFGIYYRRLVARGMPKGAALVAVMRKMLIVAVHVLKTKEVYDPSKVAAACAG